MYSALWAKWMRLAQAYRASRNQRCFGSCGTAANRISMPTALGRCGSRRAAGVAMQLALAIPIREVQPESRECPDESQPPVVAAECGEQGEAAGDAEEADQRG